MNKKCFIVLAVLAITVSSTSISSGEETSYDELLRVLEKHWLYPLDKKAVHECVMIRIANDMILPAVKNLTLPSCFERDKHMSLRYKSDHVTEPKKEHVITTSLRVELVPSGMDGVVFGNIIMTKNVPDEEAINKYFAPLFERVTQNIQLGGFIINETDNTGGYVSGAAAFLRLFASISVEPEQLMFEIRKRNGDPTRFVASKPGIAAGMCIAVLVDKNTASAAEAIAYVLQSWGAYVVGEVTYKKGTMQILHTLHDNAIFKFTNGRIFFGDGTTIDERGVIPNHITNDPHTKWEKARSFLSRCYAKKHSGKK